MPTPIQEKRRLSNPTLLYITDAKIDPETKMPRSGWLPYLQKEANLQGVTIEIRSPKDVDEQALKKSDYPLILLDMPYLDFGINEMADQIKKLRKFSPNTQILVTTAAPNVDYAIAAFHAGASDYVTQSINQRDLRAILKS